MRSSWRSTPTAPRSWLPRATATRPARLSRRRPGRPRALARSASPRPTRATCRRASRTTATRRLRLGSRRGILSTWPGQRVRAGSSTEPRWRRRTWPALVGLIRSLHPEASVGQVRQILALSSDKVGAWRVRRRPVRHLHRLHLGTALRLRPDQRPARALDGRSAAAAACHHRRRRLRLPRRHRRRRQSRHEGTGRARLRGERPPPEVTLHLRYRVQDDSGRTSERLLVYRKTKLLKTLHAVAAHDRRRGRLLGRVQLRERAAPTGTASARATPRATAAARLRGDPHSVEDPGRGGRPRPSSSGRYGWPKTNGSPLTLRLRRIAVRSVPPVKPVVT